MLVGSSNSFAAKSKIIFMKYHVYTIISLLLGATKNSLSQEDFSNHASSSNNIDSSLPFVAV